MISDGNQSRERGSAPAEGAPSRSTRSQETVTIYQFAYTGHRLKYVQLLALHALDRGMLTTLIMDTHASRSQEFRTHLKELESSVRIVGVENGSLRGLVRLSRELPSDLVLVPDGDRLAARLGLAGRWTGDGGLTLLVARDPRQRKSQSLYGQIKGRLKMRLLTRASRASRVRVLYLDSGLRTESELGVDRLKDPVTITSTTQSTLMLRRDWGLDSERYWFAIVGAITARKNPRLIAESISQISHRRPVGLLMAGVVDPEVAGDLKAMSARLASSGIKFIVVDRMLSEIEIDSAIAAADCLVLAHSNEGPSGVLAKAAGTGVRVVAAGARTLERDVEILGDAAEWARLDVQTLSAALARAVDRPRPTASQGASVCNFTGRMFDGI